MTFFEMAVSIAMCLIDFLSCLLAYSTSKNRAFNTDEKDVTSEGWVRCLP